MNKLAGRTKESLDALIEFCDYLNQFIDCSKETIVEIGTWIGDSAFLFSEYFFKVITIDPFSTQIGGWPSYKDMDLAYNIFNERLEKYKKNNVTLYRQLSKEAVKSFPNQSISVIYIDGEHSYQAVKNDIEMFMPKMIKGGFVTGHDYCRKFQGVVDAVNEKFGLPDKVFRDNSWIKRIGV